MSETLIIREHDFAELGFPREFTFEERSVYRTVVEKHDEERVRSEFTEVIVGSETQAVGVQKALEKLSKRLENALSTPFESMDHEAVERYVTQIKKLSGSDTDARRDYLDTLSNALANAYEGDEEPPESLLDDLLQRIEKQQELLTESLNHDLSVSISENAAKEWKYDELLKIVEAINLETVYEIGKLHHLKVGPLKEWLAGAVEADHENAERLVNAGKELRSLRRQIQKRQSQNADSN